MRLSAYVITTTNLRISFGTFYSDDNHVDINAMYEGKAFIETDVNKKESKLLLKQVTLRESRLIKCLVQIPGDTEGQTSALTSLVVLVAPSDPVCKIKGTAEYGQNISLTCVSEEGSPAPTYQWQSYDVKNNARPHPPKTTEKDGVLSLFNVSRDTSGYYICTSANKIRSAKCNLTLSVLPATMKIGATAGIIGGCVAGVAVLVLIIYCCCRGKRQPEEFAMEPPLIEYHDNPKQDKQEDGSGDIRKSSIEGSIDQRERYEREMKAEKDSERHDDRRDIYSRGCNEGRRERYDDRKPYNDDQQNQDDRRSQYDDLRDQYDDRQNRYDGRKDCFSDRQDRYGDQRDRYNDRQDRFGDHRDRYNDRPDRFDDGRVRYNDRQDRFDDDRDSYDNRQEHNGQRDRYDNFDDRYDDGRDHYRQNRYDDDRRSFDDRAQDYDDRQGRYDNHRYRYGDRQDRYEPRDRYERRDQYTDS
ncbi:hypothetical protein QTP70_018365 [Hemibagrus guttatus]|uniref:Ig-like domain-containing protein n=1 Tax=Hemibagrus guttatus TaxID=175788 RepID=A0AAE0V8T2_9TELE|nr:hypothetical protein QTP70_018365 [Hemibagrus guttatus]